MIYMDFFRTLKKKGKKYLFRGKGWRKVFLTVKKCLDVQGVDCCSVALIKTEVLSLVYLLLLLLKKF